MKQYQIQMCVNGEWEQARFPDGIAWRKRNATRYLDKAKHGIERLREEWANNNWCNSPNVPTEFRIVTRDVPEWVPLESDN